MRTVQATIGIDPGLGGAIVVLDGEGEFAWGQRTPIIQAKRKEHDIPSMRDCLTRAATEFDYLTVGIEKVHTLPRDGRVGAFSFGCGYGIWLGLLAGLGIPYIEILPQAWQARMLAGLPKGPHTKASAVRAAKSRFPHIPINVKADWGLADAALIAAYARQYQLGGRV